MRRSTGLGQDVSFALRGLRQHPAFAAAAIVTLALGIGAATAMFSVAYGVSFRPLPYPSPERLIRIYEAHPADQQLRADVSVGSFSAWREGAPAIETAALFSPAAARTLSRPVEGRLRVMAASPSCFDVLGVRLLLGEGFKREEAYTRFTVGDAVLSYAAWRRTFGGRDDIIGTSIAFTGAGDDDIYRIVGVLPETFTFIDDADVWVPQIVERPVAPVLRNWRYDRVIARLKPGATVSQARAELEAVSDRLARDFPESNAGWTVTVDSLQGSIVGEFGRATWLLLAAVALVLLVACLNVGGLLAARALTRRREWAVRVALGADASRLLRLGLIEASMVGIPGAALGLAIAWAGVGVLRAAAPPGIPRLDAIVVDGPTVLAAVVSLLIAIVVFTVVSTGGVSRRERSSLLRAAAGGTGQGHLPWPGPFAPSSSRWVLSTQRRRQQAWQRSQLSRWWRRADRPAAPAASTRHTRFARNDRAARHPALALAARVAVSTRIGFCGCDSLELLHRQDDVSKVKAWHRGSVFSQPAQLG